MLAQLYITEWGHFLTVMALVISVLAATIPLAPPLYQRFARRSAGLALALSCAGYACLTWAFITTDLSVELVATHSHILKPFLYKITGVWGNHEGSLLLWILILQLMFLLWVLRPQTPEISSHRAAMPVRLGFGLLSGFLTMSLLTANPFARLNPAPLNGQDLNPVLQDPALAIHPPLLYVGYAGTFILFIIALRGIFLESGLTKKWAAQLRQWTLVTWSFLSAGIFVGSFWAYYELGWGGWWFWDPVENVALIPWLSVTALLHCVISAEARGHLLGWSAGLAASSWFLSLLGAFTVRSGVITSVHSFASDPTRGAALLSLLAVSVALYLLAWGAQRVNSSHDAKAPSFTLLSREFALAIQSLFFLAGLVVVLGGTFYPLLNQAMGAPPVSIGPPFYNLTFVPIIGLGLVFAGVSPHLTWRKSLVTKLREPIILAAAMAIGIALALHQWGGKAFDKGMIGIALAVWLIVLSGWDLWAVRQNWPAMKKRLAGALGHASIGLAILGMVGSTVWLQPHSLIMQAGETHEITGYNVTLATVIEDVVHNYNREQAVLELVDTHDSNTRLILRPERRWYPIAASQTTEVALAHRLGHDLYASMGQAVTDSETGKTYWQIEIWRTPLIPWLWIGWVLMLLAGPLSLWARRDKIGGKHG